MDYQVSITGPAEQDIRLAFEHILKEAPDAAERWLDRLFEAIFSLQHFPKRCARIRESNDIGRELRHLVFGESGGAYRIIFDIVDDPQLLVRILRVWHGARQDLSAIDVLPE